MGRLKDWAYRPFDRQRYKGLTVPEYLHAVAMGSSAPGETTKLRSNSFRPYAVGPTQKVAVDNGFWSQLMPRNVAAIDFSDIWNWDWDVVSVGPAYIMRKRVPPGLAWHIDNLYFFGTMIGGVGGLGSVILPPMGLANWLIFRVFVNSSQLKYTAWESLLNRFADPKVSFPFLNDRVGPREAKFGVTLYENEAIYATVQTRLQPVGIPPDPPPYPMQGIGFRFMGIEAPKLEMDDYLNRRAWKA